MASTMKKLSRWSALGAVAALALTGCSTGGGGGDESVQDTIVFHMGGDPNLVNPTMTTGFTDQEIGCTIFEGLTQVDEEGLSTPHLAESWDISEDGLEYTFHLVDANWSDGEPFTSADVKFTYENFSSQYAPLWSDVRETFDTVETPDEHTAVVKLKQPFAPFILLTSCASNGAILPQHIYEGVDPQSAEANNAIDPIGTGPFMLVESKPGQSYTFDANPDYWQEGLPHAKHLVGRVITDSASTTSAIRAGEIDFISVLDANSANQLKEADGITVENVTYGQVATQLLFFNVEREPFNNPEVRKALFQALDRQYIIDHVFFGLGEPGVSAITSMHWAYTGAVDYNELYPYDVDAANAALDAAGYPKDANGTRFSMDLLVRNDPPERVEFGNVVKAMWAQVGVNVNVTVMERASENPAAFQEHNFDANIQGYGNYGDPASGTARVYNCAAIGRNFGNPGQYCNPELDALWTQASQETDVDKRKELYGQIDEIIAEDLPTLVVTQYSSQIAYVSNLDLVYQAGAPDWANTQFK